MTMQMNGKKVRRKTKAFTVHVPKIEGVSDEFWQQYITDAVKSWCGQAMAPPEGQEPDEDWLMVQSDKMNQVEVTRRNVL